MWLLVPLLVLLSGAPASTLVAGATWLLVALAGLWATVRLPVTRLPSHRLVQSSWWWLKACFLALLLQAVITQYWADPWKDRHVEIRLLLGAAASCALVRRMRLLPQQKTYLIHSLALACCVAAVTSYLYGRETPSNPISWAAGVSFLVCVLLAQLLHLKTTWWQRVFWGGSTLAGVVGVLLSQSRGSYGLVFWVVGLVGLSSLQRFLCRVKKNNMPTTTTAVKSQLSAAVAAAVVVAFFIATFPQFYAGPVGRITAAFSEVKAFSQAAHSQPQVSAVNTSVGARLYMWRMAICEVSNAPFLGHGRAARIAWIHQLGETAGSDTIKSLDHLHSDPLTTLFDHGMLGILSYLCLAVMLTWLVVKNKYCDTAARWSLAGVLFMHLSSGLTNMNFGHNFYGVMLSLSIALVWILSTNEVK